MVGILQATRKNQNVSDVNQRKIYVFTIKIAIQTTTGIIQILKHFAVLVTPESTLLKYYRRSVALKIENVFQKYKPQLGRGLIVVRSAWPNKRSIGQRKNIVRRKRNLQERLFKIQKLANDSALVLKLLGLKRVKKLKVSELKSIGCKVSLKIRIIVLGRIQFGVQPCVKNLKPPGQLERLIGKNVLIPPNTERKYLRESNELMLKGDTNCLRPGW